MINTIYDRYDGLGLAEVVRNKEVKPAELVEEAISRIEKLNPLLNAVIHEMYDQARETAVSNLPDGPFCGVPFLLKDFIADYAGVPTRKGNRFHQDYVPDLDSEIVQRYKASGVIILGKTNTPEFALTPWTEPELFGPSNNPWNLTRTTGGSSGGSAAAVAVGMVPLAHGNDGGGSIRIPASCCGVFGFKPTRGRNPIGPDLTEAWHGLACDHVLTRSVRDSAAMLDATAGPDVGAPYYAPPPPRSFLEEVGTDPGKLRIAFTSKPFLPSVIHQDCIKGLEATASLCQDLGHEVVEASPSIDGEIFAQAFLTMLCCETWADIEEAEIRLCRQATVEDFEPTTWMLGLLGKQITGGAFAKAIRQLQRSGRQIGQFFETYDVMLTPTLALPPVPTGTFQPTKTEIFGMKLLGRLNAGKLLNAATWIEAGAAQAYQFVPYTPVFNATGQPAMSVPLHWSEEGLPIGMHFVGRYGDETTLFRLAGQLEQAKPWHDRTPPITLNQDNPGSVS